MIEVILVICAVAATFWLFVGACVLAAQYQEQKEMNTWRREQAEVAVAEAQKEQATMARFLGRTVSGEMGRRDRAA